MAIDALADVTADPDPSRPVVRLQCARDAAVYVATGRPDPGLLLPWLAVHGPHDPTLPTFTGGSR